MDGEVISLREYKERHYDVPSIDEELRAFTYICFMDQTAENLKELKSRAIARRKENPNSAHAALGLGTYQLLNKDPRGYRSIAIALNEKELAADCIAIVIETINRRKMDLFLDCLEKIVDTIIAYTPNNYPAVEYAACAAEKYLPGKDIKKRLDWSRRKRNQTI